VLPQPAATEQPAVVMASMPMPQPTPEPNVAEAPQQRDSSLADLFGGLFGSSEAQAPPSALAAESEPVVPRGTNTELAAKPRRTASVRTASAPIALHPKPREAAPPKKVNAVAHNAPAPAPQPPVQQAGDDQKTPAPAPAPELRTAYSAPPASNNNLPAGAQPVVPANTFESRWAAIR
jgi:hypothetical protein